MGGRRMLELVIVIALIGFVIGSVAKRYTKTKRVAYMSYMQAELHNLLTAQEAYFATTAGGTGGARYADSLEKLGFVPRREVMIEVRGNARGWTARATSIELPDDHICAVFVGQVDPFPPAAQEGEVTCQPQTRDI